MRHPVTIALKTAIPWFAEKPSHPFVPLDGQTAGARSEGQGRRFAGASRAPLTAASTLAGLRRSGDKALRRCAVLFAVGTLSVGSGLAVAQSMPIARAPAVDPYAAPIAEASKRFGIPERWIRAVLRAESAGDARAISSVGAVGLMQVMPDTWAGLRIRHRLGRDPYDPRANILAGTAFLREMWDRYGNVAAMLASYNAGPNRYDEHRASGRPLPAETRAYVAALAPILGGAAVSDAPTRQPAPPPDWREAPLFITRPNDSGIAAALPSIAQSGDTRATVPVRDSARTEPQSGSIFVARASDGGTP
ncbi:lytic transglycosylase domain-containing protein [Bradyrhizobium sp. 2TAF24]|uniref:lytic transglycosylase domain-containing protein n=1 Tax=Bradyrhizobium sp. 2TAF24 TaxID=3233011 RepID=UPI003F9306E2